MRQRIVTFLTALTVVLAGLVALAPTPASAEALGPYRIKAALNSAKCLDVTDVSYANGALLQMYDCLPNQQNQRFWLYPTGYEVESYQIVAVHSGKCLDVKDVSQADWARIQQYACLGLGQTNQVFLAVHQTGQSALQLVAIHSSKPFGHASLAYNGAAVMQYPQSGTVGTYWLIQP